MNKWSTAYTRKEAAIIHPSPPKTPPSDLYQVHVNGQPVFVYPARVSAQPVNQVWPGYQRPHNQTEMAAFASFDMKGRVFVEVTADRDIESAVIRPRAYWIEPTIEERTVAFELSRPCHIVVEINGHHHALHLFANPPEEVVPAHNERRTMYFGPGVHRAGKIRLRDGWTVYIAGGAVVYGVIQARGAEDIRVLGRGILDTSTFRREETGPPITLKACRNVQLDGIILRDPHTWSVALADCSHARLSNLKLVGLWRYNADGIDLINSRNVRIEDCFIRAFDDNIALKGIEAWQRHRTGGAALENIEVRRCVLWNDWGRALEIGAETQAEAIRNVVFQDVDIIHFVHRAMDIQNGDRATVEHVLFEDIRVEEALVEGEEREDITGYVSNPENVGLLAELIIGRTPYSKDSQRGQIRDVVFRDITAIGARWPRIRLKGLDADHTVERVTFENLRIQEQAIRSAEQARAEIGPHVRDVQFIAKE